MTSFSRRHAMALGAGALAAPMLGLRSAAAQGAWPSQPVRMIVPFAAGGPTDIPARLIAEEMSKALPHRVVVENRTGSGVVIGTDLVAKGPQDGTTILYTTVAHAVLRPMFPRLPFDPIADFTPVALVGQVPVILLVHNNFPARNIQEFIQVLRANPGRFDYASSGNGGAVHLATELFMHAAGGLKVNHVPFRGSSAAMPDVLSGRIPMIFDIAASALPYARSGELRALGISTKERSPLAPNIPTIAEQGVPGFDATQWYGLVAPAGTPRAIVDRLNAESTRILRGDRLRPRLESEGADPSPGTPEQFRELIVAERARWGELIRIANVRAD